MSLLLKECRWCGNPFVQKHFNDAYCSDKCREEKERERDRRRKKMPLNCKRTRALPGGVPTIPDVVSATMEHKEKTGRLISYGKMVAIIERKGV